MDLKETPRLRDQIASHWYYRSKARAMTRLLGRTDVSTILDVGAGSGFFSRHLLSQTTAKEAWCVDPGYGADSDTTEAGKPVHFRHSIGRIDARLVLMMDVLEHVDDDVGLLKAYAAKVPAGTPFLVSVPAFQFLWSGHDVFLEHRRRYTLRQIEEVARRAGLTVKQGLYYFGAVFPIAATSRLLGKLLHTNAGPPQSQLKQHPRWINEALAGLCYAELPLMTRNRLAGLTAFCLAESGNGDGA